MKDECQQNQWPMGRIVSIETDEKKAVRTVTFHFADSNVPGRTQFFRRPITKIVMLVGNNEFDSPNRRTQTECSRLESSWGSQMKRRVIKLWE